MVMINLYPRDEPLGVFDYCIYVVGFIIGICIQGDRQHLRTERRSLSIWMLLVLSAVVATDRSFIISNAITTLRFPAFIDAASFALSLATLAATIRPYVLGRFFGLVGVCCACIFVLSQTADYFPDAPPSELILFNLTIALGASAWSYRIFFSERASHFWNRN